MELRKPNCMHRAAMVMSLHILRLAESFLTHSDAATFNNGLHFRFLMLILFVIL